MREMNESVGFYMKMAQLWVDFILKEQTIYKPNRIIYELIDRSCRNLLMEN